MRKVLISPGYGAGWSSWNTGDVAKYMLEYAPIIAALERGEKMSTEHPAVLQLEKDCKEKFGRDYICVLGADQLKVCEVKGRVRINEYDGSESLEKEGEFEDWM